MSWLSDIGSFFKKIFTSPVVEGVASVAGSIVKAEFPEFAPLIDGVTASITKAEGLAASAGAQAGTGPQKLALALQDAESVFQAYETASGTTLVPASKLTIVNSIVAILNALPAKSA
jgi:hypothetical protein